MGPNQNGAGMVALVALLIYDAATSVGESAKVSVGNGLGQSGGLFSVISTVGL